MLAPVAVLLLASAGWPLLYALTHSFQEYNRLEPDVPAKWTGLENYATLLADEEWWGAVRFTLSFAVVSVALETVCGLALATSLNNLGDRSPWWRSVSRGLVLMPWALPTVVAAQLWRWIFHDIFGLANAVVTGLQLVAEPIPWLARGETAFAALVIADVWKTTPFMCVLLLAGLQSIPPSLHEAASVDGASAWARFRHITLPLLMPAIIVAVLLRLLDALRVFDMAQVLIGQQPGLLTVSQLTRRHLVDFGAVGYGSTMALGIVALLGVVAVAAIVAMTRQHE